MSWTTPRTWVTGEVVTATIMNSAVRDNLSFLFDPPAARITGSSVSIASGSTPAAVGSMGTVQVDTTGGAMTAAANKITITKAGLYEMNGGGQWAINSNGNIRRLGFIYTGSQAGTEGVSLVQNANAITVEQSASDMIGLAVNDTVQLAAAQNAPVAINLQNPILVVAWAGAG